MSLAVPEREASVAQGARSLASLRPISGARSLLGLDMQQSPAAVVRDANELCVARLAQVAPGHMGELLVPHTLNSAQMDTLGRINEMLAREYQNRKLVLVKRLEVTYVAIVLSARLFPRSSLR